MLVNLQAGSGGNLLASSETGRFERGLYGCSEMFVNGFLWLIRAGIVRIEVYDDVVLQRLVREGSIDKHVTAQSLRALLDSGRIHATLTEADVEFLKRFGFFRDDVRWVDGQIIVAGKTLPPTLADATMFEQICAHCLGNELRGGYIMHGGFFLGPRDFYQALRDMPKAELQRINMTRILYINELLGHEELARLQRRNARFINTTMMVTMLGAVGDVYSSRYLLLIPFLLVLSTALMLVAQKNKRTLEFISVIIILASTLNGFTYIIKIRAAQHITIPYQSIFSNCQKVYTIC